MYPLYITESRVFCCTWRNLIFKNFRTCLRRSLIVRASIKKTIFTWNIRRPSYKKYLYQKCLSDQYKKLLSFNTLFGAYTKELFPLKMLDGAGMAKTPLTQYFTRGWHEKAVSTENARRHCYRRISSTQTRKTSFHVK